MDWGANLPGLRARLNYTRNEWRTRGDIPINGIVVHAHSLSCPIKGPDSFFYKTPGGIGEKSGKPHSKRVGKMQNYTRNECNFTSQAYPKFALTSCVGVLSTVVTKNKNVTITTGH